MNTILIIPISLILIAFLSGCEKKHSNEPLTTSKSSFSQQNESEDKSESDKIVINSNSYSSSLDTKIEKIEEHSEHIDKNTVLHDTGITLQKQEVPIYAIAIHKEIEQALRNTTNEKEVAFALNKLLSNYWVEDLNQEIIPEKIDLLNIFDRSKPLLEEIHRDGHNQDLRLRSTYAFIAILKMFSELSNPKIDGFFKERIDDSIVKEGDLILVKTAYQLIPFRGKNHKKNLQTLHYLSNAKNPAFRALAVVSGKNFLKDDIILLDYLKFFSNDTNEHIVMLTIKELAIFDDIRYKNEIREIGKKEQFTRNHIYKYAEVFLTKE